MNVEKFPPPDDRWIKIGKNAYILPRDKMTKEEKKSLKLKVKKFKTKKIIKSIMDDLIDNVVSAEDSKITSESKKGNKGERGEIKIIEFLFDNMNNEEIINEIFSIKSRIKLIDPSTHEIIYNKESIKKTSGYFKADIIIDFIDVYKKCNVSIKCNDGAPPTSLCKLLGNRKAKKRCPRSYKDH